MHIHCRKGGGRNSQPRTNTELKHARIKGLLKKGFSVNLNLDIEGKTGLVAQEVLKSGCHIWKGPAMCSKQSDYWQQENMELSLVTSIY